MFWLRSGRPQESKCSLNIQHSSRTDRWYTPKSIIERVKLVLGEIDLDPASDDFGNERVGAKQFYTQEDDGRSKEWSGNIFCNPPGGKTGNKSNTALFWEKLMQSSFKQAVFLAFSLEALQTCQSMSFPSPLHYTLCVPRRRIAFDTPNGSPGKAPSHSNVIVYVHGSVDKRAEFRYHFNSLGNTR